MKSYFAHTAPQQADWELLKDHLVNVAKRAYKFAAVFDAGIEASIAGYLHDLGKYGVMDIPSFLSDLVLKPERKK